MILPFHKYQGTGNDFIMVDSRSNDYIGYLTSDRIKELCNRRFGIGADGLIMLSSHPEYDFEMIYFNSDGLESTMCGNGGRCITLFAYDLGLKKVEYNFLAIDGPHSSQIVDGNIHLKMKDVNRVEITDEMMIMDTGSPHVIVFVSELEQFDVESKGRLVRELPRFNKEGINVNFVEITNDNSIKVRTYERGVEGETLSCGTGVTAASLATHYKQFSSPIAIQTPGGQLEVRYVKTENGFSNIYLIGPAKKVFEGELEL